MRLFARLAALVLVVGVASTAAVACSDTQVVIARAPDVDLRDTSVSVFGVYSDGRWNAAEWDKLRERLTSLGKAPCEPGFGEPLRNTNKELFVAIDREARSNGISDKLATQLSPGAQGDVVLIIELWGALGVIQPSTPTAGGSGAGGSGAGGMGGSSGMGGPSGMGGSGIGRMRPPAGSGLGGPGAKQQDSLRMVARVFAPDMNEWVGAVELRYSGDDPAEAVARFDESLGKLLPGAHCAGWSWKAPASSASASTVAAPLPPPAPATSTSTSASPTDPDKPPY